MLAQIEYFPALVTPFTNLVSLYISKLGRFIYGHVEQAMAHSFTSLIEQLMEKIVVVFPRAINEEYDCSLLAKELALIRQFFLFVKQLKVYKHKPAYQQLFAAFESTNNAKL
jgi:hypothetical protein